MDSYKHVSVVDGLLGCIYSKRQRQRCQCCNPFWSDFIVFNESSVAIVLAELTLTLGVNRPQCNRKGPFRPSVSVNVAMTLAILLSLKTMELLKNRVATHFGVIPLFSMRAVSLASLQHWVALTLTLCVNRPLRLHCECKFYRKVAPV